MIKVFFCYPSDKLGGAELLFYRCASYLSKRGGLYDVNYIDFKNGYIANKLTANEKIKFIEYVDKRPLYLEAGSVIVIPLNLLVLLKKYFCNANQLKFLCWSINPTNLTDYVIIKKLGKYSISSRMRKKVGLYLHELSEKGTVIYMDYNNYYSASTVYQFKSKVNFTPIFIDDFIYHAQCERKIHEPLTFMWLGRLDNDKVNTIATFIKELNKITDKKRIRLDIIGTGEKQDYLEKLSKGMDYEIRFLGRITGEDLDEFILNEVDVGLAMGLSALEIGKLGKPVILEGFLNAEKDAGVINDYILLCDSNNYDVVSPGYWDKSYHNSFEELVAHIDSNYELIANDCARYVSEKHTISNSGILLEEAIEKVYRDYDFESYCLINHITRIIYNLKTRLIRKGINMVVYLFGC